uniref:MBD domain-containing protein n=1 Tax=Oryza glumipatula TaxID=40148 RepID=A0A0D9ZHA7_9ORYZ
MGKSPSVGVLHEDDCDEVKFFEEPKKNLQSDDESVDERPGWLPDGWIMEVYRGDDGTICWICPFSGITFTMKSEVLYYLFSEMDQRFLESKNCAVGNNLTRTHEWLPKGWLVEIRASGDNMDKTKIYRTTFTHEGFAHHRCHVGCSFPNIFYMYPPDRVRLFSKDDVLLYIKEMKISEFDTDGQCNTRLPQGWVKEVVFRKTNAGRIRRDWHYTNPIKNYVFRTMRSTALYLEIGKVTIRAFVQKTSVHEVYSFEKFTHLHESLRKRLNLRWTNQLRTQWSKLQKLSLKEEILSDEQGSSSSKFVPEEQKFIRFSVVLCRGPSPVLDLLVSSPWCGGVGGVVALLEVAIAGGHLGSCGFGGNASGGICGWIWLHGAGGRANCSGCW